MKNNKILSIIVPTYNMEKYLDKCLSSLIISDEELMCQLEVIVVNDGSKDSSSKIAHGYVDRYPETYIVIDKENGNYGSCINAALPVAKGKYVKVLDADDWFDTIVFENYLTKLQELDVDLVLNDMHSVTEGFNEQKLYNIASLFESEKKHQFEDLLIINTPRYIAMHCLAYKTENILSINYKQTEGISYTDVEWDVIPMRTVKTFASISGYLYKYRLGREGQTVDPIIQKKSLNQLAIVLKTLVRSMAEYNFQDAYAKYMQVMFKWHATTLYCAFYNSEVLNNVIRPLDIEIKTISNGIYKEMNEWTLKFNGENIRYVAGRRHPWMELLLAFIRNGYRGFVNNLDYMTINNMLHPVIIVKTFYTIKNFKFRKVSTRQ